MTIFCIFEYSIFIQFHIRISNIFEYRKFSTFFTRSRKGLAFILNYTLQNLFNTWLWKISAILHNIPPMWQHILATFWWVWVILPYSLMNEYWKIHIRILNIRSVTENIRYSNIIHIHWGLYYVDILYIVYDFNYILHYYTKSFFA